MLKLNSDIYRLYINKMVKNGSILGIVLIGLSLLCFSIGVYDVCWGEQCHVESVDTINSTNCWNTDCDCTLFGDAPETKCGDVLSGRCRSWDCCRVKTNVVYSTQDEPAEAMFKLFQSTVGCQQPGAQVCTRKCNQVSSYLVTYTYKNVTDKYTTNYRPDSNYRCSYKVMLFIASIPLFIVGGSLILEL